MSLSHRADADRHLTAEIAFPAADLLHCAQQRGGSLELLGRKQAQRVTHEDMNAGIARVLNASVEDCEGCLAEVGLGLAATCWKEDEVDPFAIGVIALCDRLDGRKKEGKLEWPPIATGVRRSPVGQ